ncbi:hypothetical protein NDU88_007866 [Pleurodeles waltl]|uniref:Uncharacterized protein n=1 Tax=Pleurodeles waltl TaxID=8319 RepID=A0AAV7RRI9_PLEWA|nr:hypothetical protein NDU88_007866 [Pleurodeles waltl]
MGCTRDACGTHPGTCPGKDRAKILPICVHPHQKEPEPGLRSDMLAVFKSATTSESLGKPFMPFEDLTFGDEGGPTTLGSAITRKGVQLQDPARNGKPRCTRTTTT